jgi:Sulfotransferase family
MTALHSRDAADPEVIARGRRRSPESPAHYAPYAVDWRRFLPEGFLYIKDVARFHLSNVSNTIARRPGLTRLWAASIGRRTISSIARAGILFIHVPKAGGTSISQCLYGRNLPHYSASFYRTVFPTETASLPSFATIRHPVERLLSAYAFYRAGGTDLVACDRHYRRGMGDLTSIEDFVDRVYTRRIDLAALPSTFHSQCDYIADGDGKILVDRLFSLDSRIGFSPELPRWLGRSRLPHINVTGSKDFAIGDASRRKVREIYARDFALYRALITKGGHLEVRRTPSSVRLATTGDGV